MLWDVLRPEFLPTIVVVCIVMSRPWRMRERSLRAWRTALGRCEQLGSAEGLLKEALQVL